MKTILLLDMHNLFIRNWIVNPTKTSNGTLVGGIYGTLKSLQKFCNDFNPSLIFAVWDGEGGNKRKRLINKDYKEGRKVLKNKNYEMPGMNRDEEKENQLWQQLKVIEYFNEFPIIQFMEDSTEADDIIAFIAQREKYKEYQKIIISSDQDFLQLVDDDINVYFPTKNALMSTGSVVETYGIHPHNFVIARAIAGDSSDNLKGIQGAGLKSISKQFDFLSNKTGYYLENIYERCQESNKNLLLFKRILEGKDIINQNYKIMQLTIPDISISSKEKIKREIDDFSFKVNKLKCIFMMRENEIDPSNFYILFSKLFDIIKENK